MNWSVSRCWFLTVVSPYICIVVIAGTNNPRVTQKQVNTLKVIRNPICQNPDIPIKVIRNLVPNIIRIQWPRGLTLTT